MQRIGLGLALLAALIAGGILGVMLWMEATTPGGRLGPLMLLFIVIVGGPVLLVSVVATDDEYERWLGGRV